MALRVMCYSQKVYHCDTRLSLDIKTFSKLLFAYTAAVFGGFLLALSAH